MKETNKIMHLDSRKMINLAATFSNGLKTFIDRLSGENRGKFKSCGKISRIFAMRTAEKKTLLKLIIDDGA